MTGALPGYFALGDDVASWSVSVSGGVCATSASASVIVPLEGWCEIATGGGTDYEVRAVNGLLMFSGSITGTVILTGADPCVYRSSTIHITIALVFS